MEELKSMICVCADSYVYAIEAFSENSKEKALKVIEKERLQYRCRNRFYKPLIKLVSL